MIENTSRDQFSSSFILVPSSRAPASVRRSARVSELNRRKNDVLLRVVGASSLEHLGKDGDSRVDGVGDDEDKGLRAVLSDALGEITADAGVDLEEVVAGLERRKGGRRGGGAGVSRAL